MPLDNLPAKLVLPSRDQERDRWIRDYTLRNPAALAQNGGVGQGSLPWIEGSTYSDVTAVHRSNAVTLANGTSRATRTGAQLDADAASLGTWRLPPVGGAGFVSISTGVNGASIVQGMILTGPNNYRAQALQTGTFFNGSQVAIAGLSVGPSTNLAAGTILQWQGSVPGLGGNATIVQQADGSGLSGGNGFESDDQLRFRLDYIAAHPPASGNDAQYQALVMVCPGLSVQQAFTYPAILGPGTKGVTFTLRPPLPGASRIPTAGQLAICAAFLAGNMPADDSIFMCTIVGQPVSCVFEVAWAAGAAGWADATTFPLYHSPIASNGVVAAANASGALTPTAFRLTSPAMTEVPLVGQSVGFLDLPNLIFRRKKILTVTTISSTAYDITVDTTGGLSDTGYTPVSGQACCPWSDSLSSLIVPAVSYFDTLGTGEQVASFFDPGLRQRRSPPSPQYWPNQVNIRLLGGATVPQPPQGAVQNLPPVQTLLTTPTLLDIIPEEPSLPYGTNVGTPGVSSNMITLGNILAFPGG